ncbi:hypothetical protein C2R22_05870 [Salinigranum rubrum]|uniref:Uncharacterized protein n=1 Tax=Salinigranum rubrum TaxID=755307 RepID=A0A2I8VH40_9EURY|nr:hypothetical protein [Salinigranum rubrum]AUV81245.1 hypothetical protein C2R22_05870 [Salinigranum rubrum]
MLWNPVRQTPVTTVTIDSFEDQDLAEYTNVDGGDWTFVTSPVRNGTFAAQIDGFNEIYSLPGDGLPAYYGRGNGTLRVSVRSDGNASPTAIPWFRFGAADNANSYYVRLDFSTGDVGLNKEVTGSTSTIANTSITVSDGEWYEYEIIWDDGTLGGSVGDLTLTVTRVSDATELTTLTSNDTDAALESNEGIGFVGQQFASGEAVTWDAITKE